MPFRPVRRSTRCALVSLCLLLITGCQSFTASSSARLRVIDLSADAGPLDIRQGGHALASNLSYGTVTSYAALPPGVFTGTVSRAGSRQTLTYTQANLLPGGHYTLLIHNPLFNLQQTLLLDQPAASVPTIRLLHQAGRAGPVDIYQVPAGSRIASVTPIVTNFAPGASTGYLALPPGTGAIFILPAGTRPWAALALHTGPQIEYLHGSARTLILLDAPLTLDRRLDVVETVDGETPAQSPALP